MIYWYLRYFSYNKVKIICLLIFEVLGFGFDFFFFLRIRLVRVVVFLFGDCGGLSGRICLYRRWYEGTRREGSCVRFYLGVF